MHDNKSNQNSRYLNSHFGFINSVIDANKVQPNTLSLSQIGFLTIIWGHINSESGVCWLTQNQIKRISGVKSDSTYYKIYNSLVDTGWIKVERRLGSSNVYRLSTPDNILKLLIEQDESTSNLTQQDNPNPLFQEQVEKLKDKFELLIQKECTSQDLNTLSVIVGSYDYNHANYWLDCELKKKTKGKSESKQIHVGYMMTVLKQWKGKTLAQVEFENKQYYKQLDIEKENNKYANVAPITYEPTMKIPHVPKKKNDTEKGNDDISEFLEDIFN